jgi:anhydro-N-acetylmuramic acid kinase
VTAAGIFKSLRHLPKTPKTFVICGGGRLNRMIMLDLAELARTIEARVVSADDVGLNGDSMEAEAWAYLAVRSMRGLPLTFPGTTGVEVPVTGGVLVKSHAPG